MSYISPEADTASTLSLLGGRRKIMGKFPIPRVLRMVAWAATGVMGAATLVLFATAFLFHR